MKIAIAGCGKVGATLAEQLCKENGITFYRLAKDIGISRQALSLWKRGETKCLSVLNLIRIAISLLTSLWTSRHF